MKNLILALALVLMLGSMAHGGWYVAPRAYAYYPPAMVYAPAPVPYVTYAPIMAPPPVWAGRPVVVGPAGRLYVPGRPVRNAVRVVLP
jgi:hypothetical protein